MSNWHFFILVTSVKIKIKSLVKLNKGQTSKDNCLYFELMRSAMFPIQEAHIINMEIVTESFNNNNYLN